jgi:hypothetical protein
MYKNDEKKVSIFKLAEKHFRVHKKCDCDFELLTFLNDNDF